LIWRPELDSRVRGNDEAIMSIANDGKSSSPFSLIPSTSSGRTGLLEGNQSSDADQRHLFAIDIIANDEGDGRAYPLVA
jgi:hypothetical protein